MAGLFSRSLGKFNTSSAFRETVEAFIRDRLGGSTFSRYVFMVFPNVDECPRTGAKTKQR